MDEKPLSIVQHQKVQKGRIAKVLLEQLEPYFREVEYNIVCEMKNLFRMSSYNEVNLASLTAKLVSMDDLRIKLGLDVKAGDSVQKELRND